jgi:predicted enzyme related to lactoylglutathione lyase
LQYAGPTIVSPFPKPTNYFAAEKQWMLNLRVSGLDALVEELAAAGISIVKDPEWDTPETGRFARVHDPEGNAIELWEPPAE